MNGIVRGDQAVIELCTPIARQLGVEIEFAGHAEIPSEPDEYLSVAITKSPHGQIVTYPAVLHSRISKRLTSSPRVDHSISALAQRISIEEMKARNLVGSAVFILSTAGELLKVKVGLQRESLWTLDFAYISHFENEVRSAHNLPLGASSSIFKDWFTLEYSAPVELDMTSPYLHLFAHNPKYKIRQLTSHTGLVALADGENLESSVMHAVDYLEGNVNE